MNKKRLHYLEQTLTTLQSAYNDLTVIRDEEEHDFENIPDNKSNSELAEQTVKNAEDIDAAVYDLGIVIDILKNIMSTKTDDSI